MAQVDVSDNIYKYPEIESHYISGNVVKVNAVNLPLFVDTKSTPSVRQPLSPSEATEQRPSFKIPLLFRANRLLQVGLIALSAIALGAYSLDVIMSHNLMLMQEKARRLSEQNCELSARLLKSISFQGIQESVLGHRATQSNLRVPEEVLVAAEVPPAKNEPFRPSKHHLPLMSGY